MCTFIAMAAPLKGCGPHRECVCGTQTRSAKPRFDVNCVRVYVIFLCGIMRLRADPYLCTNVTDPIVSIVTSVRMCLRSRALPTPLEIRLISEIPRIFRTAFSEIGCAIFREFRDLLQQFARRNRRAGGVLVPTPWRSGTKIRPRPRYPPGVCCAPRGRDSAPADSSRIAPGPDPFRRAPAPCAACSAGRARRIARSAVTTVRTLH